MLDFSRFSVTNVTGSAHSAASGETGPRQRLRALMARSETGEHPGEQPARARWSERWLPSAWTDSRVALGRPGLLGLCLAGLLAVVVIAFGIWVNQPSAEPAPKSPPPPVIQPVATAAPERLVISVVGRVSRPGLVTVAKGDRVADALEAAGGALPDTDVTTLNLARKLADGEQLYVGIPPPPQAPPNSVTGQEQDPERINLNSATREQLESLPGVGEATAEGIVRWREENGGFSTVDQLREVDGIGEAKFSRLREQVQA